MKSWLGLTKFWRVGLLGVILSLGLTACGDATGGTLPPAAPATATATPPAAITTVPPARPTVATSPVAPTTQTASSVARAAQEDEIREALLRNYLGQVSDSAGGKALLYFVTLTSVQIDQNKLKDPTNDFLKRFQYHNITLKKASEADVSPKGIVDKSDGQTRVLLGISEIKWLNDNEVEVEQSYYRAAMAAGGTTYQVVKENKRWVVKGTRGGWAT
jgi:hypothetical protein